MNFLFKAVALVAVMSSTLVQGYAIVFDKDSPIPYVDIYVYKVDSPEEAIKKHANFARATGLPQNIVDILEKGRGVSAKVAGALGPSTDGASVFIQQGFYQVVDAGKLGLQYFKGPLNDLIGRAFRGDNHAYHKNVWRGNRGRGAEWATNNPRMYAIVTLPNNLVALNEPQLLPQRGVTSFTITTTPDPENPGNTLYKANFNSKFTTQYLPAENDKRDLKKSSELAKINGDFAYNGSDKSMPAVVPKSWLINPTKK